MTKSTKQMPDLSNATPGGIVDMCVPDQREYNRLDGLTKYLKQALYARLLPEHKIDLLTDVVAGENYTAVISKESRSGFSLAMAIEKGYITQDEVNECTVQSKPHNVCRFYDNGDYKIPQKREGLQTPALQEERAQEAAQMNDNLSDLFQE